MNLNGYTLKAVKTMETMNGIAYSGNIYFGGKKVAFAYNDGRGSETVVDVSDDIADYETHDSVLTEAFVGRLFDLHDNEKIFKSGTKNKPDMGVAFVTITNPFRMKNYICSKAITVDDVAECVLKSTPGCNIESIEIFRSLDDFNIEESQQQEMDDGGPDFADDPGEDAGGMTMQ